MTNNESIKKKQGTKTRFLSFVCICAILFSFFPTGILSYVPLIDRYIRLVQFAGLACIVVYFLFSARLVVVNRGILYAFAILLIELFTTLFRDGSVVKVLFETIRFVGIIWMITNEGRNSFSRIYDYLIAVLYGMGIFSLLYSIFINVSNTSLFGLEGELSNYAIPIIAILYMDSIRRNRLQKILYYIFAAVMIYCMLFVIDSSTAKVGSVLIVGLVLFDRFAKKVNPTKFFWIFVICFLLIVIFRITNYFGFIIEDVLQESITLHKRTYAWDYAIDLIKESPIWGYGYIESMYQYSIIYKVTNGWFAHPHNELLRLYLLGGLFNVISAVGMMFYTAKRLNRYYQYKSIRIITYALFTMLIMSIVETCFNSYFYLLIGFAYSAQAIIEKYEGVDNKAIKPKNKSLSVNGSIQR